MKTFSKFIRERREALKLTQADIEGFGQSYIADIESGRIRPSTPKTIEKIARGFKLDTSEKGLEWLRVYSLLNRDPYEAFQRVQTANNHSVAETSALYGAKNVGVTVIQIGDSEDAVRQKLGEPDRRIEVPATKSKWIYRADDLHIIFVNGRVNEVVFK